MVRYEIVIIGGGPAGLAAAGLAAAGLATAPFAVTEAEVESWGKERGGAAGSIIRPLGPLAVSGATAAGGVSLPLAAGVFSLVFAEEGAGSAARGAAPEDPAEAATGRTATGEAVWAATAGAVTAEGPLCPRATSGGRWPAGSEAGDAPAAPGESDDAPAAADGAGFAGAGGRIGTTVMPVFWPPRVRTSNVLFLSWATWLSRVATLCSRAFNR